MNLMDVFRQRYSVRRFLPKPIPTDVWQNIMEAGRLAATSRNKQARRFVVINEPARIAQIVESAKMQEFVKDASVLVVGCAPQESASGVDVIISLTQMETMAVAEGVGAIWLGVFDRDVIAQEVKVPVDYRPVLLMAFGYPAEEGTQRDKLPKEELFVQNSF